MMKKGLKYFVQDTREGGRCIAKAKGHHQELILAFVSDKINFRNFHLLHVNLVIARAEIKFGEELSTLKIIQKVSND
jgi:hypothetical protein